MQNLFKSAEQARQFRTRSAAYPCSDARARTLERHCGYAAVMRCAPCARAEQREPRTLCKMRGAFCITYRDKRSFYEVKRSKNLGEGQMQLINVSNKSHLP